MHVVADLLIAVLYFMTVVWILFLRFYYNLVYIWWDMLFYFIHILLHKVVKVWYIDFNHFNEVLKLQGYTLWDFVPQNIKNYSDILKYELFLFAQSHFEIL